MAKNTAQKLSSLIILTAIIAGCSGIQRRNETGTATKEKPTFDEPAYRPPSQGQDSTPLPAPNKKQRAKVALVLGPGAFKTFAYPSFIKSLVQAGVNPDMVVGVEWGALTASFFALNGKSHEAEWKLYKLEEKVISPSGLFSNGKGVKVDRLRGFLQENLGNKLETQTQIPFRCPILRLNAGTTNFAAKSALWQRVESCLASPPRFEPVSSEVPSLFSLPDIAKNLRREGYGVVILVNVLGNEANTFNGVGTWAELAYWVEARRQMWNSNSDFTDVIQIDTSRVALFDFNAKTLLQDAGDKAGRQGGKDLVEKYQL